MLVNRGARLRWEIENEGFNLEHAYSTKNRRIKNYYLLLQIAHLILQLMEKPIDKQFALDAERRQFHTFVLVGLRTLSFRKRMKK